MTNILQSPGIFTNMGKSLNTDLSDISQTCPDHTALTGTTWEIFLLTFIVMEHGDNGNIMDVAIYKTFILYCW